MNASDEHERPRPSVVSAAAATRADECLRTADPPLAQPVAFCRTLWRDLRRSLPLARELAKRDLRIHFRQPLLGTAAAALPPLVMTAVGLGFREAGLLTVDEVAIPYGLFVLAGVVLWITFLEALNAPIHALLAEQGLLARSSAPAEAVLLGRLGSLLANLGIRLLLLALAVVWFGAGFPASALVAPLGLAGLVAFGFAVGLLLAPLNLIFRDISRLLAILTTFWLFLSPVFFPAATSGVIGRVMQLNPVTPFLSWTRSALLTGDPPDLLGMVALTGAVLLLIGVCWFYLRITLRIFIERSNA